MLTYTLITDTKDERLVPYFLLNESQLFHYYEPEPGIFIAESAKVISRALAAGYEPESFLVEAEVLGAGALSPTEATGADAGALSPTETSSSEADLEIRTLLSRYPNVPIYAMPREILRHIPGYAVTRGLLCALRRKKLSPPAELLEHCNRIAVLESVDNPTNVGSIFRSAAALSMDAVILTDDCTDPLYRRAARVSMGCVFQIPYRFFYRNSQTHYVDDLRALGYTTCAMALTDDCVSITDPRLKSSEKLAIIMGSEGHGLSEETIRKADYVVKIPMAEGVDSLNVAAASALAFWELGKNKD